MPGMSQIQFFAQGDGTPEWLNVVILLAFVLISAFGGLIKRYREGRQQQERTGPVQPGQKTRATVGWRQRLEQELERARTEATQRTAHESEADRTPSYESSPQKHEVKPGVRPAMAKTRERERAAGDIRRPALQMPEPSGVSSKPQTNSASAPAASRVLIDLSTPDALKKAIIQYEVLGKPLGLRDFSSDGGSGRIY
jgi:cytoskeletal protein RodZ